VKALLDTHILLYWLARDSRLTQNQIAAIDSATAEEPLWVSDITMWEIAALASRGRIKLHLPLRDWLEAAVAPPLVRRVSISPAVASEVASLPNTFHRDPADRIIVASARNVGATLLTQDRRIIDAGVVATL
jgi:PIN domain nuclease of toxin-antitoxin system